MREDNSPPAHRVLHLLEKPNFLLATILIANNMFNIAIVFTGYYIIQTYFTFSNPVIAFLVNVVFISFLLVLFGEVLPKVFATENNERVAKSTAPLLAFFNRIFAPLSKVLVYSTNFLEKRIQKITQNEEINFQEIGKAIEIVSEDQSKPLDKYMLKGIINFGNVSVRKIMRSRVDITAIDINTPFVEMMETIKDSGYSRIPVFEDSLDNIKGLVYVKDLLPFAQDTPDNFEWRGIIRPPFFIPESKKIATLLEDFRRMRLHIAIVVDEYGGTSGLVTLEDILEEVVGDIYDEFDVMEEEIQYQRLDDDNYIFHGKTLLRDISKIIGVEHEVFEQFQGVYTLAGLILELANKFPEENESVSYENFTFTVLSKSENRIDDVRLTIHHPNDKES